MDKKDLFDTVAADPELKKRMFNELINDPDVRDTLKQWLIGELVGPGEIERMVAAKEGGARLRQAVGKLRVHPAFPEPIRLRMGDIYMRDEVAEFLELDRPTGQPGQRVAQAAREAREAANQR